MSWTYLVTNSGQTSLTNVTVTADQGVAVTCPQDTLAAAETMNCTASGTAVAGQYANVGVATGTPPAGPPVAASDPSHYFGITFVINEIHADPSNTQGDANGDGVVSATDDEFVELVNATAGPIDISGWTLADAVTVRHTFPPGTVVPGGCAAVVFGGGTLAAYFGGSVAQTASTGQLGLNNTNETVTLSDGVAPVAVAMAVGVLNIALLYRQIGAIGKLTVSLWAGTLLTTAAVIVTGAMHFDPAVAFDFPAGGFSFSIGFLFGLGAASRVGIYDYLGYYNVAYIGDEVKDPGRVIPRSILISVVAVALIYLGLNL